MPHSTALSRALVAADEPTGLVVAVARLHPAGISSLKPESVLKKFSQKSFAAGVDRAEVMAGARLAGIALPDLFEFIIGALRPSCTELGI